MHQTLSHYPADLSHRSPFQSNSTEKQSIPGFQSKEKARPTGAAYVVSSGTSMDQSTSSQPRYEHEGAIQRISEPLSTDAANKFRLRNLSFIYSRKQSEGQSRVGPAAKGKLVGMGVNTSNQWKKRSGAPGAAAAVSLSLCEQQHEEPLGLTIEGAEDGPFFTAEDGEMS